MAEKSFWVGVYGSQGTMWACCPVSRVNLNSEMNDFVCKHGCGATQPPKLPDDVEESETQTTMNTSEETKKEATLSTVLDALDILGEATGQEYNVRFFAYGGNRIATLHNDTKPCICRFDRDEIGSDDGFMDAITQKIKSLATDHLTERMNELVAEKTSMERELSELRELLRIVQKS